ncbi:hypothetical protein FACS189449_12010 [Alphaproteobacteria bacterium]|nr:hypothetical protein FACS189449_12010 [Alphaproteobacteria bacterium]
MPTGANANASQLSASTSRAAEDALPLGASPTYAAADAPPLSALSTSAAADASQLSASPARAEFVRCRYSVPPPSNAEAAADTGATPPDAVVERCRKSAPPCGAALGGYGLFSYASSQNATEGNERKPSVPPIGESSTPVSDTHTKAGGTSSAPSSTDE